ncbi:phosphate transport system ATP-binding protein [Pullulanibacillus pueri]|uniref:Phosphate import ATP-binding protein PstB 2 n=1 Tax=Pullulanibacillus pueri TaxID=1437324 RepID=A0A8J3EKD3_9BACL|nr:phosphate ABC transporter ATP-binding protein PstB [Pullulanibacillus pueri]MBM7680346.1 phosphate transport system ATP-binding protein [Pullulanibacillus pueri]GGH75535.1 phosphate import ATP-binding protein PstB 2 [Pullulanibacillus pueri]
MVFVLEQQEGKELRELEPKEHILNIKQLDIYYGNDHAVKDISLDIEKNAITALIGPSGCGKSTFLRAINRMNDRIPGARCEGSILYDGVSLLDKEIDISALRKEIGMVFQKPNPFPKSIKDNITHALKFHGITKNKKRLKERVKESLQQAALWDEVSDRLDASALSLSGGQQQRLCLARTLALRPKVILLDEPTSALDPISTGKIESLLMKLKKEYTIVVVTHNMQQAARIADHIAFFYQGELVEQGKTEQMFNHPTEKRTASYISGQFS